MNIFELNMIATPLASAIGAASAAKGHGTMTSAVTGALGFIAGVGIYLGYIGIMAIVGKRAGNDSTGNRKNSDREWLQGLLAIPFTLLPIISAIAIHHAVHRIL